LAGLSGLLSTLSPCVLPLLPLVVGGALAAHRWGPLALALGLALSYTALGLLIATMGVAVGVDPPLIRKIGGALMLVFGLVLLLPPLQARFERWSARLSNAGARWSSQVEGGSLAGQFALGTLLGAVWAPCVGPTLGAAITLAGTGRDLGDAAATMLVFGIGAALPLALVGFVSRQGFAALRPGVAGFARRGKVLLGALFALLGLGILTGWDHTLEIWLLRHSPDWLTELTTRY
jgi:cytochrome c biogenesis protein CcdA